MKKENFMDNFLSESYKEVERKINEMNEKLKSLKEFDDEFNDDFEFDSEAEEAARKDIEDSEGEFQEIGKNTFEKNINITPEKFKIIALFFEKRDIYGSRCNFPFQIGDLFKENIAHFCCGISSNRQMNGKSSF